MRTILKIFMIITTVMVLGYLIYYVNTFLELDVYGKTFIKIILNIGIGVALIFTVIKLGDKN